MGLYSGSNDWIESVYQFEQTDAVMGGPDGIDNVPLQNLADRTVYLKNRLGLISGFNGVVPKVGNGAIIIDDIGKFIYATANGVNDLLLPNVADLKPGTIVPIAAICPLETVINLKGYGSQQFAGNNRSVMYMHNNEHLMLIANTDSWIVFDAVGNFFNAGEEVKGRKEIQNTLAYKGQLVSRVKYPRLTEFALSLENGKGICDEATWQTNGNKYKGYFSYGDGATTIRLPDERGLFERMLDLGRGMDTGRQTAYPGGFEDMSVEQHAHGYKDRYFPESGNEMTKKGASKYIDISSNNKMGAGMNDNDNNKVLYEDDTTYSYGGAETRPRNIGKLNLVRF